VYAKSAVLAGSSGAAEVETYVEEIGYIRFYAGIIFCRKCNEKRPSQDLTRSIPPTLRWGVRSLLWVIWSNVWHKESFGNWRRGGE